MLYIALQGPEMELNVNLISGSYLEESPPLPPPLLSSPNIKGPFSPLPLLSYKGINSPVENYLQSLSFFSLFF